MSNNNYTDNELMHEQFRRNKIRHIQEELFVRKKEVKLLKRECNKINKEIRKLEKKISKAKK